MADEEEKKSDLKSTMKQPRKKMGRRKAPGASTPQQVTAKDTPQDSSTYKPDIVDPANEKNVTLAAETSVDKQADLNSNPESSSLSSETVVLKVVKDKKKKLAGILSKSQSIRLRPQVAGTPTGVETPIEPGAPRGVLKIKPATGAGDDGSAKAAPSTPQRPTLKVKSNTNTGDQDKMAEVSPISKKIPDSANKVLASGTDASNVAGKLLNRQGKPQKQRL